MGQFTVGNHSTLLETIHNAILRDISAQLLYHLYIPPILAKQIASYTLKTERTTDEMSKKMLGWIAYEIGN